ncbi:Hydroxyacid-oxoacid transhydrogenase, mitochondrial, partial [Neolecta irregularis DAH-3]
VYGARQVTVPGVKQVTVRDGYLAGCLLFTNGFFSRASTPHMAALNARTRAQSLLSLFASHDSTCLCHANPLQMSYSTPINIKEYAFEWTASSIRYGNGVTHEVGMDFKNLGVKKVGVITDKTVAKLPPMKTAISSLENYSVLYEIFDNVRIEPKDYSMNQAIEFARNSGVDSFLAVGGGSAIDTAKVANLFSCYPDALLLDFVNAPIGKGLAITNPLKPLIAIPTTAGTGSETTGTAIFDLSTHKAKTGISSRALKPILGLVDPLNTRTMSSAVHTSSGLDVLCHALESFTALPYKQRTPRPENPILRPAYQGSNPISDIWSMKALKMAVEFLPRVVKDSQDHVAQEQMLLAATFAGIGFGNAGVTIPHACSYAISGLNQRYRHAGYNVNYPIIPHGVSVAVTAPSVFAFTGASDPGRHLEAARVFGVDTSNLKHESAGEVLSEAIATFLIRLGNQPRGLKDLGYSKSDIPALVEGTLPQQRVLSLAPMDTGRRELEDILDRAMEY